MQIYPKFCLGQKRHGLSPSLSFVLTFGKQGSFFCSVAHLLRQQMLSIKQNRCSQHNKKKNSFGKTDQLLHTNPPYQLQASDPSVKFLHLMHGHRLPPRKPTQPLGHSIRKLFVVMVWNLSVYNFPNYLGENSQSLWYYHFSLDLSSDNQFCSPL